MNAFRCSLRAASPQAKRKISRDDYSPQELAAFREEFTQKLARRRRRRILFFLLLGMASVVWLLITGEREKFLQLLSLFAGVLILWTLMGKLVSFHPRCPACRHETDLYVARYCPVCGEQSINQETRWGPTCRGCGAAFHDDEVDYVDFLCYCTSCGIQLTDESG